MAIAEVGTFQDVRAVNLFSAQITRTGTIAGHLITGTVRWATTETCTVTCPGQTVVVVLNELNPTNSYSHCQWYILLTAGGSHTITASFSTSQRIGHYVAEFSGNFNASNVLFGFDSGQQTGAQLSVADVPAGALVWGVSSASGNPNIQPNPPLTPRTLQNENFFSDGGITVGSAGGLVTYQNQGGGTKFVDSMAVYQEDTGAPPIDKDTAVRGLWRGVTLGTLEAVKETTARGLWRASAQRTPDQTTVVRGRWRAQAESIYLLTKATTARTLWRVTAAVPAEFIQASAARARWRATAASEVIPPPVDKDTSGRSAWRATAVSAVTSGGINKDVAVRGRWRATAAVPAEFIQDTRVSAAWRATAAATVVNVAIDKDTEGRARWRAQADAPTEYVQFVQPRALWRSSAAAAVDSLNKFTSGRAYWRAIADPSGSKIEKAVGNTGGWLTPNEVQFLRRLGMPATLETLRTADVAAPLEAAAVRAGIPQGTRPASTPDEALETLLDTLETQRETLTRAQERLAQDVQDMLMLLERYRQDEVLALTTALVAADVL